jgi:hypothetical protein
VRHAGCRAVSREGGSGRGREGERERARARENVCVKRGGGGQRRRGGTYIFVYTHPKLFSVSLCPRLSLGMSNCIKCDLPTITKVHEFQEHIILAKLPKTYSLENGQS